MMPDTPTPTPAPVLAAFDALIARLQEHALSVDFDRAARYRASAIGLRDRWASGEMPRPSTKREAV